MKIRINLNNIDLWCLYCKEPIEIGQRYIIIEEEYQGEVIFKYYHAEHAPIEEDEEVWIGE